MEKNDIKLEDWQRILEGNVPHAFLLEVVIRIFFVYLLVLVAVRLMGNRMASDLGKVELVSRICLAAAIGLPLQTPDRGLLASAIVASFAVFAERVISWYATKNRKFEILTQDNWNTLIADAVMQLDTMKRTRITRERLFAQLRSNGIEHLGEVERFYFEANGAFSLLKKEPALPGLSILPDWDEEIRHEQPKSDQLVCTQCGIAQHETPTCVCGSNDWQSAVRKRNKDKDD